MTDYSSVIPAKTGIQGDAVPVAALDPLFRGADSVSLTRSDAVFEEQAAPATSVRGYWQSVFYRLRHDPVTLAFAAIVLLIVLTAICAPLIAPFDPFKESRPSMQAPVPPG